MKTARISSTVLVAAMAAAAMQAWGLQAFSALPSDLAADGSTSAGNAQDTNAFADGTRAINAGRWADAIAIFSKIAAEKGDRAEGALYWEAYAENKLGKSTDALNSCSALRTDYPKSSWIEDCGALEIEIRARSGQPVLPKPQQTDDLRLLALNSLMQRDPAHAQAQIQEILDDEDSSEKLRNGALFILGKHQAELTFPEIVRVSYVDGDVRVARGRQAEKSTGAEWEKAQANLPLESGYSLVTGAGRAEIELEDASTIYLGENSVLSVNDLHTTDSVPYTDLALLSGTATLHVRPFVAGEMFVLRTPGDANLLATYSNLSYLRVTSYADATAITALDGGALRLPGTTLQTAAGQTLYYSAGHRIEPPATENAAGFDDWDKWVADRVAKRTAAMSEVMAAAGVTSPLPGMAEMAGQGRFFDCAPYGRCWESSAQAAVEQDEDAKGAAAQDAPAPEGTGEAAAAPLAAKASPALGYGAIDPAALNRLRMLDFFPCSPYSLYYRMRLRYPLSSFDDLPYRWTVCHSGYWIRHRRHYVWVVGKRHHHEPLRWVKSDKIVAYVPIHPKDVKGEKPVNVKSVAFAIQNKNSLGVEPVKLDTERPLEVLNDPPKEFRAAMPMPLMRAEEPRMVARELKAGPAGKSETLKTIPITFDHKSQTFMIAHAEMHGSRSVTVNAPIGGRSGSLQAHAGGFSGESGSHAPGGGGSHSGGSSGGSGGGSHGGGSSGSTASSGGSSGSSSGGGSHH
jgi:ferric-dicitrate binding protein FerR (iron transport regulator)